MSTERAHEVGDSMEADFDAGTWTFRMPAGYYQVRAGMHALVPVEAFTAQTERLARAERILRLLMDTQNKDSMGEHCYEAVVSFFDPPPIV